ncbi:MAG: hypothetical protein ACOCTP_02220 [Roseicyclus sp.]
MTQAEPGGRDNFQDALRNPLNGAFVDPLLVDLSLVGLDLHLAVFPVTRQTEAVSVFEEFHGLHPAVAPLPDDVGMTD